MARNPQARSVSKQNGTGRRVLIVAVPPVRTLDLFGPLEVFNDANRLHGGDPKYKINIISGGKSRVILSHIATPVHTDLTFREYRGPVDTLLVAGVDSDRQIRYERGFLDWLKDHSQKEPALRFDLYGRSNSCQSWPPRRQTRGHALELV